jgi:hypothetical protein
LVRFADNVLDFRRYHAGRLSLEAIGLVL